MRRGYVLLWRKIWANPVLQEREKRFSRMEAWLYLTSVLATGVDDPDSGLKRGEFRASVRQLAGKYDGPTAGPSKGNGGSNAKSGDYFDCDPGETSTRRTSRGDPIYRPRQ